MEFVSFDIAYLGHRVSFEALVRLDIFLVMWVGEETLKREVGWAIYLYLSLTVCLSVCPSVQLLNRSGMNLTDLIIQKTAKVFKRLKSSEFT